jgi:putative phosphoribosyl transferase
VVVCLATPEPFHAVGLWYEEFTQTTDEEVTRLIDALALTPPRSETEVGRLPMRTTEIPQRDWSGKLDELSRIHEGWLVSLDIVMAQAIGAQHEFRQMPLVGITAEPTNGGTITIAVAEPTGEHVTHMVHSPMHVFIEKTREGKHAALEIDSADGTKAVLKFRSSPQGRAS